MQPRFPIVTNEHQQVRPVIAAGQPMRVIPYAGGDDQQIAQQLDNGALVRGTIADHGVQLGAGQRFLDKVVGKTLGPRSWGKRGA